MDEGTARFGFLGAMGLCTLCAAAALWLGMAARYEGARLFLVLALLGLVLSLWFRRIYHRLRRVRWDRELTASQSALDRLLHPTAPAAPAVPPPADREAGPPTSDTNAPT
jgi:hypothetical protein